jgi:RNA polymerase sigma-70 factor (ECF subfamily)
MEDECLVSSALSGDISAFEKLTKMYYDSVRLLAFSILKEQQEAEDIAQETFLKAYSRLRELRKPSSFSIWLRKITRNLATNRLKQMKRFRYIPLEEVTSEDLAVFPSDERLEKEILIEKVMQAIETLPEEERGILRGKYLEGRRYEELARRYNLSYNAAVVKAHRARRKVRDIVLGKEILVSMSNQRKHLKDIIGKPIPERFCSSIELVEERLSKMPGVLSIMVRGSVARGWADDYSDLDIYTLCESIPPKSARREAYAGFGPPLALDTELGTEKVTKDDVLWDEFDIHHSQETSDRTAVFMKLETLNSASQWVERIVSADNPSEDDRHDASSLQDGLIVFDQAESLNSLRNRIHPMPDLTRRFLVTDAVEQMMKDGYEIECAKKSALRGDVLSARHHLWFLIKHIANVCLYFNGKYYPGAKNILTHLSHCDALPTDCIQRLEGITLNPDAKKAVQDCIHLAQEAIELTKDILPEEQCKLAFDELEWFSKWDGRL